MGLDGADLLKEQLIAALAAYAEARDQGRLEQMQVDAVVERLGAMPPEFAPMAANQIGFWMRPPAARSLQQTWVDRLQGRKAEPARLPRQSYIDLFSHDGYRRQAALGAINGAPSPFFLAAIALRLNDWVPQVRQAAEGCARRIFPQTDAAIIITAAPFLMDGRWRWKRWGPEVAVVDDTFARADVVAALANEMVTSSDTRMGRLFALVLRSTMLDGFLDRLAADAILPQIRALATRTLLSGEVKWRVARRWEYSEQIYNRGHWAGVYQERLPPMTSRPLAIIEQAARDRAVVVRKIAADAIISRRLELGRAELLRLTALLRNDKSAGIRERMAFVARDLG